MPSKLHIFAWRLARSSLPTGEVRAHRDMPTSPNCSVFNATNDTCRHSLLQCNMASSVWPLKEDDSVLPIFGDETDDPKLWLIFIAQHFDSVQFIEVLATLWAIWWARRKLILMRESNNHRCRPTCSSPGTLRSWTQLTIRQRWLQRTLRACRMDLSRLPHLIPLQRGRRTRVRVWHVRV